MLRRSQDHGASRCRTEMVGMTLSAPSTGTALQSKSTHGAAPGMEHVRVNGGLLAEPERHVLRWLVERVPAGVRPDHLTALGVAGALLVMAGFLCANISPWFVSVVLFGLFLNWIGDSLDGTLARYRRIERPQIGYFTDHSCDLISQTLIFIGLGCSPYFTRFAALLALTMYLLISSYTYLKVMILRTHQLSYGGMGATELRLLIGGWSLFAIFVPGLTSARIWQSFILDDVVAGLWILVFLGFIAMVWSDLARFRGIFGEDQRDRDDVARTNGIEPPRGARPAQEQQSNGR